MSILKDITELVEAGVITNESADKIQTYYKSKKIATPNGLFIVFGILGAILIGLGVIMIVAHNWDNLSRGTKTAFAFIPLLIGQALCGLTLFKKQESITWRESSAVFLFFAVGACIALVSQIYNMPGNLSSFLFIWMLLCLPVVYVMKSSAVSLMYIIGVTNYATESGFGGYNGGFNYYWLLLLLILPYYYNLYKKHSKSNFLLLHNWIIPGSMIIALGTLSKDHWHLIYVAYFSLFALFYLIGEHAFFDEKKLRSNSYKILGSVGTVVLLLMLSFEWFWERLLKVDYNSSITSPELIGAVCLTLLALVLLYRYIQDRRLKDISPVTVTFLFFILTFCIGIYSAISILLINVFIFILGIWIILEGERRDNFGVLNYGLFIITALIVCRFFDIDLSFIFRGLIFVAVGVGFFLTNYWMLKKRKLNDK